MREAGIASGKGTPRGISESVHTLVRFIDLNLMRLLLVILTGLLLTLPAWSYPAYVGAVQDSAGVLSPGQIAGLQRALRELEQDLQVRGTVLALPAQSTWDLSGYGERTLAEWQAQGVMGERSFLLLLVPEQHRMALVFDDALQQTLDPWTLRQLTTRVALECEQGHLYLATDSLLKHLRQAPELRQRPAPEGESRWVWIIAGMLILILTSFRGIRKWQATQLRPAWS